jgi:hypothetical protein
MTSMMARRTNPLVKLARMATANAPIAATDGGKQELV